MIINLNHNTLIKSFFAVLLLLGLSSSSEPKVQQKARGFRIVHNNDGTDALANMWFNRKGNLSRKDINRYVDIVADSKVVTTFMMCTGSDFVYYRSKYERTFGDDRNGTLSCNKSVSERDAFKHYYANFLSLEKEGTDIIDASLTRAKERGMEAFITFRVNDLHFADTASNCRVSYPDFWYNNPQFYTGDPSQGMNSAQALDFTYDEVRKHKLNLIREQLEKYPQIDGYDLDFMRFIVLFKTGEGAVKAPLVTSFVKSVRQMVDSVSTLRKKKILLSVRVPITVEGSLEKGLDLREWHKQELIDFISIGAHWRGETATPIAKFKKDLFKGFSKAIPVYGSIDDGGYQPREFFSEGMYRGMASHILGQGADGLYLFNFYFENDAKVDYAKAVNESGLVCRARSQRLLTDLGDSTLLSKRNKIYCASDGVTNAYGVLQVADLPMACANGKLGKVGIFVADEVNSKSVQSQLLFLRSDKNAGMEVKINGKSVNPLESNIAVKYDRVKGLKDGEEVYVFEIPKNTLFKGNNEVSILSKGGIFVVKRLEVALNYGNVKQYGYF